MPRVYSACHLAWAGRIGRTCAWGSSPGRATQESSSAEASGRRAAPLGGFTGDRHQRVHLASFTVSLGHPTTVLGLAACAGADVGYTADRLFFQKRLEAGEHHCPHLF